MLLSETDRSPRSTEFNQSFWRDVLSGLSVRPRSIPARWLYDRKGSELFEAITTLPEYYQTRTERSILSKAAAEISSITGAARAIVEFGAGSATKTSILLSALNPSVYVPIDISADFLRETVTRLSASFPGLAIHPLEGDFAGTLRLPPDINGVPPLGFFPGSTIGNLIVPAAVDLLRKMALMLGAGSMLLVGVDRVNDRDVLLRAYDDAHGTTAAFNLNLLHRINRELHGSVPVDAFRHVVRWNDAQTRIEMHLQAVRDIHFEINGQRFSIASGETIHTENSLKYGSREASVLLRAGGWTPIKDWTDDQGMFSVILAEQGSRGFDTLTIRNEASTPT